MISMENFIDVMAFFAHVNCNVSGFDITMSES